MVHNPLIIAVMGATGTGKSTFVNLASGSQLPVGTGLLSCTSSVQTAGPFQLFGREVILIDTPGFDDSTRGDMDILRSIASYLEATYRRSQKLSGVIYMHRISDFKMGGVSRRNFGMLRSLCGESTLKNILIVTNMWGDVALDVAERRERELASDDLLFKPVLDKGATMARHHGSLQSAQEILKHFLGSPEIALQIQTELVDQHKSVDQTTAAHDLEREARERLEAEQRKQEEEKRRVQEANRLAAEAQERERVRQMEEARRAFEEQQRIAQEAMERERLMLEAAAREEERQRQEVQRRLDEERQERERQAAEAERQRLEAEERQRQMQLEIERQQARVREEEENARRRRRSDDCIIF